MKIFTLTSSFKNGEDMPAKYAHKHAPGGQNVNPPLEWTDVPEGTKSFALLMYDLHPVAKNWVHWTVVNIPADVRKIAEGVSNTNSMPAGSIELLSSYKEKGYGGPNPPSGTGRHEYKFILYALNVEKVDFSGYLTAEEFQAKLKDKIIGKAEISGYYMQ